MYVQDNRLLGVAKENRGFSSYLYNRNNEKEHCVIGQEDAYRSIHIHMSIVLLSFPIIFGLAIPPIIVAHFDKIRRVLKKGPNRLFYVWATVIMSILYCCYNIPLAAYLIISGFRENTSKPYVWWIYLIGSIEITAVPIINFISTIMAAIYHKKIKVISVTFLPSQAESITSWPLVPRLIQFAASSLGIVSMVTAIQLMFINIYYVILSLIVSPVHTCFFLLYYTTGVTCLMVFITIFLKAFYMKCGTFIIFLSGFSLFIVAAMMRVMIPIVDYENRGGILSIFGSLAPSVVFLVLGYIGYWALSCSVNI